MRQLMLTVILLGLLATAGCGDQERVAHKPESKATDVEKRPTAEAQQPIIAGVPGPASLEPKPGPPRTQPRRRTLPAWSQKEPAVRPIINAAMQNALPNEDPRGIKLATELMNLTITQRLEWADREFKKRGKE